ncbi:MAG: hypothetical protein QXX09_05625, partial [Candidatus Methanomethylicia archaeon]
TESSKIDYSYRETKRSLIFYFDREYAKLNVNLYIDGKYFGSYRCDKRARLVFNLSSDVGKYLKNALDSGLNINFEVSRT